MTRDLKEAAKPESFGYAKVRKDEESKHNARKGPVERTCQETYLDKGTLSSCMNTATDMGDKGNRKSGSRLTATIDTVTEFGVSKMGQPGSNQKEEPNLTDEMKQLMALVTVVAKHTQDVNRNDPDSEHGSVSKVNTKIDTDGKTGQVEAQKISEITTAEKMRSCPSKTVNDAPNDEVLKGEKSERSETVRHTRVREDEKSKHNDFKDLIDKPCEKTYLMESTLNPSLHPFYCIELYNH